MALGLPKDHSYITLECYPPVITSTQIVNIIISVPSTINVSNKPHRVDPPVSSINRFDPPGMTENELEFTVYWYQQKL